MNKLDLIVNQDYNGLNAGSFFIRNTPEMRLFLDFWSDNLVVERVPSWPQKEQCAMAYLITNHPFLRERVGFIEQRLINAYPGGVHNWIEGELLVHFAGCWYFYPYCL